MLPPDYFSKIIHSIEEAVQNQTPFLPLLAILPKGQPPLLHTPNYPIFHLILHSHAPLEVSCVQLQFCA